DVAGGGARPPRRSHRLLGEGPDAARARGLALPPHGPAAPGAAAVQPAARHLVARAGPGSRPSLSERHARAARRGAALRHPLLAGSAPRPPVRRPPVLADPPRDRRAAAAAARERPRRRAARVQRRRRGAEAAAGPPLCPLAARRAAV